MLQFLRPWQPLLKRYESTPRTDMYLCFGLGLLAQYIWKDRKFLEPVVCFAVLVQTSLWARAKDTAHIGSLPSQERIYCTKAIKQLRTFYPGTIYSLPASFAVRRLTGYLTFQFLLACRMAGKLQKCIRLRQLVWLQHFLAHLSS